MVTLAFLLKEKADDSITKKGGEKMNLATAYGIHDRMLVLLKHGTSIKEIKEDISRRYPAVKDSSLEDIMERVSVNISR